MNSYSKSSTPILKSPGNQCYYEGANSFRAADIGTVQAGVERELQTLESDFNTHLVNLQKKVEDLDVGFGEKFISINDKKLGFVDVEAFTSLITKMKSLLESSASDSSSFFSTCANEISNINQWLETLESNASSYQAAKNSYDQYLGRTDENSIAQAANYKSIMDQYQRLSGEPTSYGDWIKE